MNDTPKLKVDGACDVPESRYRRYPFHCPLSSTVRLDNMQGRWEVTRQQNPWTTNVYNMTMGMIGIVIEITIKMKMSVRRGNLYQLSKMASD